MDIQRALSHQIYSGSNHNRMEVIEESDGTVCYWNGAVVEPRLLDLDIIRKLGSEYVEFTLYMAARGISVGSYVETDQQQRAMVGRGNDRRGWR